MDPREQRHHEYVHTALTIDPVHPQTLYAATSTTVHESMDGANTWTAIDGAGVPDCRACRRPAESRYRL